ncbi:MAG: type IV toxin-antitoxin system AbiEi family antitoxin domain-containing protein [Candidatus Solibacter sp.]|jgi:hypothetical protein
MLTVGLQSQTKLNWLQRNLREGLVVDAAWLERRGYSSALRSKYVAHGWLDQVARGVYRRPPPELPSPGEGLRWRNVVVSLQTLLERPFVVGGRTALELQGSGHYLSASGPREIHLYGDQSPPGWVFKLRLDARFIYHNAGKLFREGASVAGVGSQTGKLPTGRSGADPLRHGTLQQTWGDQDWPLTMSSPERAILELFDEVPQRETFHQADMLMEGLRNLSPQRLHKLLVDCRSIKVKRLFFWFAERHNHAWLKKLDRREIDLGRGRRMLVRGGKLDKKYNITVPESLDGSA